jgi:Tol biopolymer transport system component
MIPVQLWQRWVWSAAGLGVAALACNAPDSTSPSSGNIRGAVFSPSSAAALTLTGRIAFVSSRDGNDEIYRMSASDKSLTRLTHNSALDETPAWSPNGAKLAFVSNRAGNNEIYVMNSDGTNRVRLTNNPANDHAPAWSPDGSKIAFVSNRTNTDEIFVMKADGKDVTQLTHKLPEQGCQNCISAEESPTWSPDSKKIAFLRRDTIFGWAIDVMNADGTGLSRLINAGFAARLSWGPTGKIAFDPHQYDGGFKDYEIWVVTVNGAVVTRLTNNDTPDDRYPTWSPDGSKIAFESDRSGNFEIYAMNANGTGLTRLTNNSAIDGQPAWGP